ncbi:MAG: lytic transglycosylase domain-containing protein [Pyrinomonadaceae bacterium]
MRSFFIVLGLIAVSSTAFGQKAPKTFDNFDRSQGVSVYLPPAPQLAEPAVKKGKHRRSSRMEAAATNQFVKPTSQTGWTVKVSDGLASRSEQFGGVKLTMGSPSGLKGFTTGNSKHDAYILDSSRRYSIDPLLIYSQMHQESTFNERATSNKGASGLMQLMPGTARRFGVTKIYDPQQNIEAGVKYMRWLLDTFHGDIVLALAGYNAGEGAVMKYGWQVPPYRETQEYVRRITGRYTTISNPQYARSAMNVSGAVAARLEKNESRPLTAYEPDALAIRLPGGKMMLVNQ